MQPIFTMQYGEFAAADELREKLKASVFVPTSAQEKGIDFLLYRPGRSGGRVVTVQVKTSRSYSGKHRQNFWFNRFVPGENADWFLLFCLYPKLSADADSGVGAVDWDHVILAFRQAEMKAFLDELHLKKNPEKPDSKFAVAFDRKTVVFQTRGCGEERDISRFLLSNRLPELQADL